MRLHWRAAILAVCFALLVLRVSAAAGSPPPRLVIGLLPEINVFRQMERFKPLAAYLSEATGVKVQLTILSRYGNIVDGFGTGKLDGAFLGSFTGALAIEQLGVVPLVRPVGRDGDSTYSGLVYVRQGSGIDGAKGMRGKRFAFVDPATTAGYIFPLAYLRQNGIADIDRFFGEYFFAGSHDAAIHAVLAGKADIGASKNTVFDFERRRNPRIDRELVVLARSAEVPSNGLCVRRDLDAGLKARLKQVLQDMDKSARGQDVLEKFGALRFVQTQAADYRPVRDMAAQAGIDLKKHVHKD